MRKNHKKIVFIEDKIDLKILHLSRKLRILNKSHLDNLLIICCNYELTAQTKELFENVRYIFELIKSDDLQYQAYCEAKKAALIFLAKTGQQYKYLHYSLLPHLQETFYNILLSEFLVRRAIEITKSDSLILLPQRKIPPVTFYAEFGFGQKNGIFGAVLKKISKSNKNIKTKNIPFILGVLCAPRITHQFLFSKLPLNWILLTYQDYLQQSKIWR